MVSTVCILYFLTCYLWLKYDTDFYILYIKYIKCNKTSIDYNE